MKRTYLRILGMIIISMLGVSALVAGAFALRQYAHLREGDALRPGSLRELRHLRQSGSIPRADTGSITPWMTFAYVNHVFGLPEGYLHETLAIKNSAYPRLTIARAAADAHMSEAAYLGQLRTAINTFRTQDHASSTTP